MGHTFEATLRRSGVGGRREKRAGSRVQVWGCWGAEPWGGGCRREEGADPGALGSVGHGEDSALTPE